jgi:hypothetical protein
VYTAEPARSGGRRRHTGRGTSLAIFGGAAVLAAVLIYFVRRQGPATLPGPRAEAEPAAAPAPLDLFGWESAPVVAARELFEAAAAGDAQRLQALFAAGAPAASSAGLAAWKPFDGRVLSEGDAGANVRISAGGRDPATASETQIFDVRLVPEGGAWKVAAWERWLSPEDLELEAALERAMEAAETPPEPVVETREREDGTLVYELEPAPVPFPESTPEELCARIEAGLARMLDFALRPKENAAAQDELVAIGAPALPGLLTALYELPLVTDVDAMRVNLVNQCLEEITGLSMGFSPQIQEGSGVGTTPELRASAIRRWFAWWQQEGALFEGPAAPVDLLDGLLAPAPASKAPARR